MGNPVKIVLPVGFVALPLTRYNDLIIAEQTAKTATAKLEAMTNPKKVTAERVAAWINGASNAAE